MELLNRMTAFTILSDEVLDEVFEEQDEIRKARLLLSLEDRAKELGVKSKFEKMVKAIKNEKGRCAEIMSRTGVKKIACRCHIISQILQVIIRPCIVEHG